MCRAWCLPTRNRISLRVEDTAWNGDQFNQKPDLAASPEILPTLTGRWMVHALLSNCQKPPRKGLSLVGPTSLVTFGKILHLLSKPAQDLPRGCPRTHPAA